MSIRHLLLASALLWGATASAQTMTAHADFINGKGEKIGMATITPAAGGVSIDFKLSQLPPGTHALHIHTTGRCDTPNFMSAGGHFNPAMKQHGKDNPMGSHAGDLPNFVVDASGNASGTVTATGVTLAEGNNSLFHTGGTALMVHAGADDYKTDPTGNAGARLACGIIQK
jgi:Cu-Zn family superoxide dismutase